MSEPQLSIRRLAWTLPTILTVLSLSSASGYAQDVRLLAVDLAQYAVGVYHPRVSPEDIHLGEVLIMPEGEFVHTFVRVTWESGVWLYRKPRTAEVQATFLLQPKHQLVCELDYMDTNTECMAHQDHTARIIANYNVRLERVVRLPPGMSIFGPGAVIGGGVPQREGSRLWADSRAPQPTCVPEPALHTAPEHSPSQAFDLWDPAAQAAKEIPAPQAERFPLPRRLPDEALLPADE